MEKACSQLSGRKQNREKEAMVAAASEQIRVMKQQRRRHEYAGKMMAAFSLYLTYRYVRSVMCLDLLRPPVEERTPAEKAQVEAHLNECERRLDLIEQQVCEKIQRLLKAEAERS